MGMSSRTTDLVQAHILLLLPGEPGFASFLLDSLSLSFLFNTIPPCPSQTGKRMTVKEKEWRESKLIGIEFL